MKTFLTLLTLAGAATLHADFSYDKTTRMTGGSMANMPMVGSRMKEPTTDRVMVKGNRMAHISAKRGQVIDLDKETFTDFDFEKRTYSVITFAEMKQAMDAAMQRMSQMQGRQQANVPEPNFTVSVKETGEKKSIEGLPATERILTLTAENEVTGENGTHKVGYEMSSDIWQTPEVPGYDEIRQFQMRMAQKFGRAIGGAAAFNFNLGMSKGFAEMAKEMAKLKGTNLLEVTRFTQTMDGVAVSMPGIQMPTGKDVSNAAGRAAGDAAGDAAANTALGSMGRAGQVLGGLGGLRRRKESQQQQQQQQQRAQQPSGGGGPMIETTTEMSNFSSGSIDASKFDIPAGFKQEEHPLKRMAR